MFARKNRPSISSLDNVDDDEMYLRKRIRDQSPIDQLDGDDLSDALSEEEETGCPLPSTPEDNQLLEAEVSKIINFMKFHIFFTEKKNRRNE